MSDFHVFSNFVWQTWDMAVVFLHLLDCLSWHLLVPVSAETSSVIADVPVIDADYRGEDKGCAASV